MRKITVNKNPEKLFGTKDNYFTIEAVTSGKVSISIDGMFTVELYCSVNDNNWELLKYNGENYTKEYNLNVGDKIHFKCDDDSFNFNAILNDFKFNVMGFVSSLWKGDNCIIDNTLTKIYQLQDAFLNTEIVDASKLILPNNTMYGCYMNMFKGCTSLTIAPELPATTLANDCYKGMFDGCTSLVTAPELPATTLASGCYSGMFGKTNILPDCSNIDFSNETVVASGGLAGLFSETKVTDADLMKILPINESTGKYWLPCTTLANRCYYQMFYGCTSLTTAPELAATTLAGYCYSNMFNGCTSLTTAPALPATTLADHCYESMFKGCTSLTIAPELPATTLIFSCYYQMFDGCTSLVTAPELPATTLVSNCYNTMFRDCTNLTTAPELPAITLSSGCYTYMFYKCTSLNYIKAMFTTKPSNSDTYNWVWKVSSTGTFVKNEAATWNVTGANGIPKGWTVETVSA